MDYQFICFPEICFCQFFCQYLALILKRLVDVAYVHTVTTVQRCHANSFVGDIMRNIHET